MNFKYFLPLFATLAACGGGSPAGDTTPQSVEAALTLAVKSAGGAAQYRLPQATDLAAIPQDPANPLTPEKVALGKLLFHDPTLGNQPKQSLMAGQYSCASCHMAKFGFQAGLRQGLGEGGEGLLQRKRAPQCPEEDIDVQPIRSPSALHVAWQRNLLWNGQFGATAANVGTESAWKVGTPKEKNHLGFEGAETQAIAGHSVHRLGPAPEVYKPMFDKVFPERPVATRYGVEAAGLAIAAYERTLVATEAPWQRWLRGDALAMNEAQKRGAVLFLGKAGCVACHAGPALSSESFHALGMDHLKGARVTGKEVEHLGRGGFTGVAADEYKYKTPQLYNLADSPFYGHGGSFVSVREVLRYKNQAIPQRRDVPAGALSPKFTPLGLSEAEIDDLESFLMGALRDPALSRYQPQSLPTGACPVHGDAVSMREMGCTPPAKTTP